MVFCKDVKAENHSNINKIVFRIYLKNYFYESKQIVLHMNNKNTNYRTAYYSIFLIMRTTHNINQLVFVKITGTFMLAWCR